MGKEAKESQVPSDIAEKIDQIRSCTRIHAEISDEDSNVIPESCYNPVEAELKFAALESKFSRFPGRLPLVTCQSNTAGNQSTKGYAHPLADVF